jgi:hypothetical protein
MNLSNEVQVDQVLGYFAAGQVAKNSDILDMANFEGVIFIAGFGTIIEAGTLNVQVQQDTDPAGGTMATLAGTAAHTVTAANAALTHSAIIVDCYKPVERYVRCVVTPAAQNAVILGVVAIRYMGRTKPELSTGLLKRTIIVSPAQA